ncbi:hypothetical protein [Variovorax sp. OV329]|uniref:hypothetical protein n=1 Tax=Variovorax sp. OV329 TaxID=1882825 RepID=UPI0008E12FE0|nr:hypothetical protein [Variovorax sp. OV329]SFN42054.1 hypothetical protein SAMN05444747_12555 [Variovorax sp. OV329]
MTSYQNPWGRWLLCARQIALALSVVSVSAFAGGSHFLGNPRPDTGGIGILPARAEPFGYSLEELAKATAAFNVTDHTGPPPPLVDGTSKFQMLFTTATNTFNVSRNTFLYVPVFLSDSSPPVIGTFPNVADRESVLRYVYSHRQLGLKYSVITIDGHDFNLDERYVVAVKVPPLPDGGGTGYLTSAAVVRPLKRGTHVIEVSASVTGDALPPWCVAIGGYCPEGVTFSIQFTVNVQ